MKNDQTIPVTGVGERSRVLLHFALRLESGVVIDTNFDASPVDFVVGDGNMFEAFEQSMFGLKAGEKKTTTIPAESAFGVANPENIHRFRRHEIEPMVADQPDSLAAGLMLTFADAGNGELAGVVDRVESEAVYVNFNHPLAGHDIIFDVHVISVENQ
tara:strand:+ start:3383 stop:3856 length:474 start_codon:yes stop_codon:yes gene_type:complete